MKIDGIRYVRVDSEGLLEPYTTGVAVASSAEHYDIIQIFNRPLLVLPVRSVASRSRIILSMHNDMFMPFKLNHQIGSEVLEQTEAYYHH